MAYIWEDDKAGTIFRIGKFICPYIEVYTQHEVNPLLRFAKIFGELAPLRDDEIFKFKFNIKELDNVILHFLAALDKTRGLCEKQIIVNYIEKTLIKGGKLGELVTENWPLLRMRHKEIILNVLEAKLTTEKTSNDYFFMACQKSFKGISLIFERSTEIYYFYVADAETEYNTLLMETIKYLFWELENNLHIIWNYHYGILGVNDTMRIGNIRII